MPNRWNELDFEQIKVIERAANSIKDEFSIVKIIETFEQAGLPLLYGQPGFYTEFLADIPANQEMIEDYCFDLM